MLSGHEGYAGTEGGLPAKHLRSDTLGARDTQRRPRRAPCPLASAVPDRP